MKKTHALASILILLVVVLYFTFEKAKRDQIAHEKLTMEQEIIEKENAAKEANTFTVIPISHASAVITWGNTVMYSDPVGGAQAYADQPEADIIFVTHKHSDHFDPETLASVITDKTMVILPQSVADELTEPLSDNTVVLANGESVDQNDFTIKAVPSYNVREEALNNHPQGRDNGYVISQDDNHVYFSGDSGPTPEMKELEGIDLAFIAMNLPYTMSVEAAAEAVLAFAPSAVYPYHYRTPDGFSDVELFKELVQKENPDIHVQQLDWYPQ